MIALSPLETIRTTHGAIALAHLEAQIEGLERQTGIGTQPDLTWSLLIDLITLRAQILGRVADYERASVLAEHWAEAAPSDGFALLSRARTRASLHRFAEALQDIATVAELKIADNDLDVDRAAILQAVGRYSEALAIRQAIAQARPDFESAAGLASLYADMGETSAAEHWFDLSCLRYRSVSPFAMAQLEFQRGHMWMARDLERAHGWLLAAWQRLPCYVQAEGHLAEVEDELGQTPTAIARLERLARDGDDPDFASELARILGQTGRQHEAALWRARAETGYVALIARHPAAFADHAANFWLHAGNDPSRAVTHARVNLEVRDTPRARRLLTVALAACNVDAAAMPAAELRSVV